MPEVPAATVEPKSAGVAIDGVGREREGASQFAGAASKGELSFDRVARGAVADGALAGMALAANRDGHLPVPAVWRA